MKCKIRGYFILFMRSRVRSWSPISFPLFVILAVIDAQHQIRGGAAVAADKREMRRSIPPRLKRVFGIDKFLLELAALALENHSTPSIQRSGENWGLPLLTFRLDLRFSDTPQRTLFPPSFDSLGIAFSIFPAVRRTPCI